MTPLSAPFLRMALSALDQLKDEAYLIRQPGAVPGVYLLFDGDSLVYVGQSSDIELRLKQHRKERKKSFNFALLYHIDSLEDRLRLETILIMALLPEANKGLNLGLHKGRVWEVKWKRK